MLHHEEISWEDRQETVYGRDDYRLVKCCGCGSISLSVSKWCSDNVDQHGETFTEVQTYPPAISREEPRWLKHILVDLPVDEWHLHELMREIYAAVQSNLTALATMGIRALLEKIMIAKIGDQGSFPRNLLSFETAGFVSKIQRECIETVLEAGHAAMHRVYRPTVEDLNALLDITETVVESIYLHGSAVEKVRKSIPRRGDKSEPEK